jgi:tetratricopeptide (TPR) repeat protein
LEIQEKSLGPEHPDIPAALDNLAAVNYDQGRYGEAEPLLQRVLDMRERILGPENPHTAIAVNNLALVYREQGRYEEAERLTQ